MDPQAKWKKLIRAYNDRNWNLVESVAWDLLYWLEHGGNPPDVTGGGVAESMWNWAVAKYACEFSLIQAKNNRPSTV